MAQYNSLSDVPTTSPSGAEYTLATRRAMLAASQASTPATPAPTAPVTPAPVVTASTTQQPAITTSSGAEPVRGSFSNPTPQPVSQPVNQPTSVGSTSSNPALEWGKQVQQAAANALGKSINQMGDPSYFANAAAQAQQQWAAQYGVPLPTGFDSSNPYTSGFTTMMTPVTSDSLVQKALLTNHTTDLGSLDWWQNAKAQNPATTSEAYQKLTNLFSNPQNLANYVKSNGIQNLKSYSWWQNYPQASDAWNLINNTPATNNPTNNSTNNPINSTTNSGSSGNVPQFNADGSITYGAAPSNTSTGNFTGTDPNATPVITPITNPPGAFKTNNPLIPNETINDLAERTKTALAQIDASNLDSATKALFKTAVQNWNPGDNVDIPNLVKTFNQIKDSTIDPHFRQLTSQVIDGLNTSASMLETQRKADMEANASTIKQNIDNTQRGLEKTGQTFTGEAVNQLGSQSAFGGQGINLNDNALNPLPVPTNEGYVPQANRLLTTSTSAKYQQQLQGLQRNAESQLGSAATPLINGVTPLGGLDGSLNESQQGIYGQTATQLYNSMLKNVSNQKPIAPLSSTP